MPAGRPKDSDGNVRTTKEYKLTVMPEIYAARRKNFSAIKEMEVGDTILYPLAEKSRIRQVVRNYHRYQTEKEIIVGFYEFKGIEYIAVQRHK